MAKTMKCGHSSKNELDKELLAAANKGNVRAVKSLIKAGADVNARKIGPNKNLMTQDEKYTLLKFGLLEDPSRWLSNQFSYCLDACSEEWSQ